LISVSPTANCQERLYGAIATKGEGKWSRDSLMEGFELGNSFNQAIPATKHNLCASDELLSRTWEAAAMNEGASDEDPTTRSRGKGVKSPSYDANLI
jgi:hypothetical protein